MHYGDFFTTLKDLSFLVVKDEVIINVNPHFSDMTEYSTCELLGRNIEEAFKIMRVGPGLDINDIDERVGYFLFTKVLEVRFVNIRVIEEKQEKVYIFSEKPNSRPDIKFPFISTLCSDNHYGIGIYSVPDLTLLVANEKYAGFKDEPFNKKENCIGKHIWEFTTGFKESSYESLWNTVINTGKACYIDEYMYSRLNRGETYWKISLVPIFDEGVLRYCTVMVTEITKEVLHRKKVEEQANIINQQNKRLEAIIQNVSDGLFLFNSDNSVTFLNDEARNFFYNVTEYKKAGDSYVHTEYFDKNGNSITFNDLPGVKAMSGEKIRDFFLTAKRPDETFHYNVSASPIYDGEGNIVSALLCSHDITELVNNERKITEQKEQLQAILDNMQECLFVFDKEGRYFIINKVARENFGGTIEKLGDSYKFARYYDLEGNEIPLEATPNYRVRCGEYVRENFLCIKFGEHEEYISLSGTPVFDKKGNFLYGIICSRRVTDFIKAEKALKAAQLQLLQAEREKNETLERAIGMKDEFLSLISHEFRTPLNVISAAIQAMNHICKDELPEKAKKYLAMINMNTLRQLRLVNNLLDITRANARRIKVNKKNIDIVFLTKAITESVHTYAAQKGVEVGFISSLTEKFIGIDEEKYERILLNLLSNAIKFTPKGKNISVRLRSTKGSISIEVKDKGIGIPEDKIELIFERFGQVDSSLSRQAEGCGIGLSLVKKFVETLGGSVSVKSNEGKGSTFTILLPDEVVDEEYIEKEEADLLDNRLIQTVNIEFSDIYS